MNCSNQCFQNYKHFLESVKPLSRNCDPNVAKNGKVYAICCRPEAAGDVTSGENVKTIEGYAVLNVEVASVSSFRDNKKNHFVTAAETAVESIALSENAFAVRLKIYNLLYIGLYIVEMLSSMLAAREFRRLNTAVFVQVR